MKRLLAFCLIMILAVSTSCASLPVETTVVSQMTKTPEPSLPPAAQSVSPEPIRIWTKSRAGYHPLRETDFHNRAIDRLLYEPLFDYTVDGKLVGVLADKLSWSEDGLTLTYTIVAERRFSNGVLLTPGDVLASLQTYVAAHRTVAPEPLSDLTENDAQSGGGQSTASTENLTDEAAPPLVSTPVPVKPYFYGSKLDVFNAVSSIVLSDDGGVAITFTRHFDNAPEYFICPILPALEAGSLYAPVAPGTGTFRLVQDKQGYLALPVEEKGGHSVEIKVFDDIGEAMKQFQNGQLDLLLLNPDEYALYSGRQNVRFQGIPVNAFTYLHLDVLYGYLADEMKREEFLQILSWQRKVVDHASFPHMHSALPVGRDDHRLPYLGGFSTFEGEYPTLPVADASLRLVREESTFDAELAENLRLLFERFGYHVDIITATTNNPNPIGDIRLVTYEFDAYPDAYAFMTEVGNGRYRGVLSAFPDQTAILREARRLLDAPSDGDNQIGLEAKLLYADAIATLTEQMPLTGLAIPSAGIAYGARVEGQLKTSYKSPYYGLEELVVWPIP